MLLNRDGFNFNRFNVRSLVSASVGMMKSGLVWLAFCFFAQSAHCADFVTVSINTAITYDAPSALAKPVYQYTQGSPLQVYLTVEGWIKVRDQFDILQWIPQEHVSKKRLVTVKSNQAKLFKTAQASTMPTAIFNRDVMLELMSTSPQNGWVKVKHQDGIEGYVAVSDVWGI